MRSFFLLMLLINLSLSAQTYEATYEFEINKDYFKEVINDEIEKGKDPSLLKRHFQDISIQDQLRLNLSLTVKEAIIP